MLFQVDGGLNSSSEIFCALDKIVYIYVVGLDIHPSESFDEQTHLFVCIVNDTNEQMGLLVKRLGWVNVQPYYVYVHDLVQGAEDLRTTVQTAIDLEKHVRGSTAGFHTPTFVVDASTTNVGV